jgi:predicted AlkP superfamily pyrophosphatase or phosphodiesterase
MLAHARRVPLIMLLLVAGLAGCGPHESATVALASKEANRSDPLVATATAPTTVVLISMDGTRPADVTPESLPSLVALAREGVRAEALIPVDPSNTFPNHVSLATGVRPEVHRLVDNAFVDPELGRFTRGAPNRWVEAEPIWSVAERHGLPAASFYWVGSEGPWGADGRGHGPRETVVPFSSRTSEKEKVDRILEWLDRADRARRPRLITAWFHGADHAGHDDGPGAPAVARSLARQDEQIARLVAGLEARGLFETTTLIFVSDHGMASAERRVNLGRLRRAAGLRLSISGIGGFAKLVFDAGKGSPRNIARAVSLARAEGLEAWPRNEAPADWHVDDVRFGDVVVRAPIGTAIVGRTTLIDGFHGYDSRAPEMAGMLVARGRGVRPGSRIGRISNLAVAPTVLSLLGLPIPAAMEAPPIGALLVGLGEESPVRNPAEEEQP